jgi:polyphosphate glucokinase
MIAHFHWKKAVDCSFPTTIVNGKCIHTGNLNEQWLHVRVDKLLKKRYKLPFFISTDADLASLAEVSLGAEKRKRCCNYNNH